MVGTSPSNAGGHGFDPCSGALRSHVPWGHKTKLRQYCNKFNKDFKDGPNQKIFKEKRVKVGLFSVSLIWGHLDHPPPTDSGHRYHQFPNISLCEHSFLFIYLGFVFFCLVVRFARSKFHDQGWNLCPCSESMES